MEQRASAYSGSNVVTGEDRAGIFSAVRHERFRQLWAASILSGVGYMTALTACGWVAFDLHHRSSTVGPRDVRLLSALAYHHPPSLDGSTAGISSSRRASSAA
jgi:hypothetical protein